MATSNMKRLLIILYVSTFSLMTPLGIGIGIALTSVSVEGSGTRTVEVAVLHGLAAGTLVYVVFFEILEKERSKKSNGLLQVSYQIFPIQWFNFCSLCPFSRFLSFPLVLWSWFWYHCSKEIIITIKAPKRFVPSILRLFLPSILILNLSMWLAKKDLLSFSSFVQ